MENARSDQKPQQNPLLLETDLPNLNSTASRGGELRSAEPKRLVAAAGRAVPLCFYYRGLFASLRKQHRRDFIQIPLPHRIIMATARHSKNMFDLVLGQ